jgi:hypothetical protein
MCATPDEVHTRAFPVFYLLLFGFHLRSSPFSIGVLAQFMVLAMAAHAFFALASLSH